MSPIVDMDTYLYHHNRAIAQMQEDTPERVAEINCPIHGKQLDHILFLQLEGCPICLAEDMLKLEKAWPRGCPSGYGENSE